MNNPPVRYRLVVVETVYHAPINGKERTESLESRWSRVLDTDEPAFHRPRLPVGPDWSPLDGGWLQHGSQLVIQNAVQAPSRIPTPAQAAELAGLVVEVYLGAGGANNPQADILIPPGESARVYPARPINQIQLRCPRGKTSATVLIVPT